MKKRIKWLDVAKGISMIAIIMGHLGNTNVNKFVYLFHVPLFVILSGYTLKKKDLTSKYVNNKFIRLMTPYFITCLFILIFDMLNSVIINRDASISTITTIISNDFIRSFFASGSITNFTNINIDTRIGAIWFLPALFFSNILTQYILNKTKNDNNRFLASIVISIISIITSKFIWLPFSIQASGIFSLYMLIGFYMNELDLISYINKNKYIDIILILITILVTMSSYGSIFLVKARMPDYLISFISSVCCSILIIQISILIQKNRILNFIGKNTIYYLCAHLFFLETLGYYKNQFMQYLNINIDGNNFYYFIIIFALFKKNVAEIIIIK